MIHKEPLNQEFKQLNYFLRRDSVIEILHKKGIKEFFPIQYQTYDAINYYEDVIGRDRTGSGKTIAYSLPVIERFRDQRILFQENAHQETRYQCKFIIILPTRQLAIQVANEIDSLKLNKNEYKVLAVYGGVPLNTHKYEVSAGIDIIVATPGRLIDLLTRDLINLAQLQTVCLDQADEMLKLGFHQDVEKIYDFIRKKNKRQLQNLLFSATIPTWVEEIARKFLSKERKFIDLVKNYDNKTSRTVEHLCVGCKYQEIKPMIANLIAFYAGHHGSVIIFCETKRQANELHRDVNLKQGKHLLHGDIPQDQREMTFRSFRKGEIKCLIATNVAARGLDIPSVDLIIQMEPPKKVDDYIHRSGRTGRAGRNGVCITFYTKTERYLINQIEKLAHIRFRNIGAPQPVDLVKAGSRDIALSLKQINEQVLLYFEDTAEEMIKEMGAVKALSSALARISDIKNPLPQKAVLNNLLGSITYIFTSKYQIEEKQLFEYLANNISEKSKLDVRDIKKLTGKALAFNFGEKHRKKMEQLMVQKEVLKMEGVLNYDYRIKLVTSLEMLEDFQDDAADDITQEQYDYANRYKQQLEVFIGGLADHVDQNKLFGFLKANGVTPISCNLPRDDNGTSKGVAFVLCLNEENHQTALGLSGKQFETRKISVKKTEAKKQNGIAGMKIIGEKSDIAADFDFK